jgi:hypothetical protein
VQDYVTVYDGYTTRDAVLLKFCGGGEAVPETVSSGPELLVEFTSSPYGTFVYPAPLQALHGFQLEVQVRTAAAIDPTAKNYVVIPLRPLPAYIVQYFMSLDRWVENNTYIRRLCLC